MIWLIIFYTFSLQAILRCLYFWQLKEYRLDRFKEFLSTWESSQYFLPTRWFLRPKLTPKILLLLVLCLIPSWWLPALAYYLLIPVLAALSIMLFTPFTWLGSFIIINLSAHRLKRFRQNLAVIGITGSYGKTATKTILAHLLAAKYSVLATSGTINTPIGVAKTILKQLIPTHKFFIVEMGAYKKGEIDAICKLVAPQVAILTGITKQHLDLFGSFDNLKAAKFELLASLPESGLAIVNGENKDSRDLGEKVKGVAVKYYLNPKKAYETNLIGDWQQLNIAGAVTAARLFGISDQVIRERLLTVPDYVTALKQQTGLNGALVVDSTYNANPKGFEAVIGYAEKIKKNQKILVTSGIIELGEDLKPIHSQLGVQANKVFNEIVVTRKEIAAAFGGKSRYMPPTPKLLNWLKAKADGQTAIVLVSRLPKKLIKDIWQNQS